MPKTDWQALDALIARDVMGYHEETSYDLPVWAGTRNDGTEHWIAMYAWRPHKDVVQALKVLDALAEKYGLGHNVSRAVHTRTYSAWLSDGFQVWREMFHAKRAKAICLAIKNFLDAPKELQDAEG